MKTNFYRKPKGAPDSITVIISMNEVVMSELASHRDLVTLKFQEKGYAVVNFNELRYYYQPKHVVVEGVRGKSLLTL